MKRTVGRTLFAAVALTLGARAAAAQDGGIAVGADAPSARVVTLEGKAVDVADYTSSIVVIDARRRVVYTGVGSDQDVEAAVKKAGI